MDTRRAKLAEASDRSDSERPPFQVPILSEVKAAQSRYVRDEVLHCAAGPASAVCAPELRALELRIGGSRQCEDRRTFKLREVALQFATFAGDRSSSRFCRRAAGVAASARSCRLCSACRSSTICWIALRHAV